MIEIDIKKAAFKHIEAELYSLGELIKELTELNQELEEWKEHSENLRYPALLGYVKRITWLEDLFQSIEEIKEKVDSQIKFFIELRYIENKSNQDIASKIGIPVEKLKKIHKLIVETVIEKLGMNSRFNEDGNDFESSRYIPIEIRLQVRIRDNNCCANCGSKAKLHFHHIEHFSEGGLHEFENLKLLCVSCHAKEHKGEKAYHLLKGVI